MSVDSVYGPVYRLVVVVEPALGRSLGHAYVNLDLNTPYYLNIQATERSYTDLLNILSQLV